MKFVGFTSTLTKHSIYINPEHVVCVTIFPGKGTAISLVNDMDNDPIIVEDSVPLVLDMLAEGTVV